jgi:hypothetical protein
MYPSRASPLIVAITPCWFSSLRGAKRSNPVAIAFNPLGLFGGLVEGVSLEISCCKAGFCRVSGNGAEPAGLVAPNARLDRHKMIKSRVMALSKAGSR